MGLVFAGAGAQAQGGDFPKLTFPAPTRTVLTDHQPMATAHMPRGRIAGGAVPRLEASGALDRRVWQIDGGAELSTLALSQHLTRQLQAAGYRILFGCDSDACGGFDFRFATDTLPEPEMHVDLGDFRYLLTRRDGADGPEYLTLMISRSQDQGFVQMTRVGAGLRPDAALTASTKSPGGFVADAPAPAEARGFALTPAPGTAPPEAPAAPLPQGPLTARLEAGQPAVLSGLVFAPGAGALTPGDYPDLAALAAWLAADPARKVTLVGHTDASGAAASNLALSRARADSVRAYLVGTLNADGARIAVQGVGALAPRSTNLTEAGRAENRRVEVLPAPTP